MVRIVLFVGKPAPFCYLYPEKETEVSVKLGYPKEYFTYTYPEYNDGWFVTAYPDGRIVNKYDGSEHYYLFWEGNTDIQHDFSTGFCVAGEETMTFLQEVLPEMGLLPHEYNEFIVYWLPLMEGNNYNLISFQTDVYTENAALTIEPTPDSILRVFMAWKPVEKYIEIAPQEFASFERDGFTVVEWGGAKTE